MILCQPCCSLASYVGIDSSNVPEHDEQDDSQQRVTKAILNAVTTVEDHAQRLVAAEVESYFHSHPEHKKKQVAAHAQKAVQEGTRKVKESVTAAASTGYTMSNVYPFEKEEDETKGTPAVKHKDHRILDAVEAAEKAVLHAIEAEVETMFHSEEEHHDAESKTTVHAGLQKASKGVKDVHKDRRSWLEKFAEKQLEDYDSSAYFLALSNSGALL